MGSGIQENDIVVTSSEAWHGLSTVTGAPLTRTDVAIPFGFEFAKAPVEYTSGDETFTVPNRNVVYRTDDNTVVNVVADGYNPPAYAANFDRIAEIAIDNGFEVHTAGTIESGGKAFVSVKVPTDVSLHFGGEELLEEWLNFGDSANGSSTMTAAVSVARVVCKNTFSSELLGQPRLFKIKHTLNSAQTISNVLQSLDTAMKDAVGIRDAVERLMNVAHTETQFTRGLVPKLIGKRPEVTDGGRTTGQTRWDDKFDALVASYHADNVNDIRGTVWGSLQSVQAVDQYFGNGDAKTKEIRHLGKLAFGKDIGPTSLASVAIKHLKVKDLVSA